MHYLQKQLLEEEKKRAKLNAGHCKTEGKKKTKLNAGHCKTESEELDEGVVQVGFKDDSTGAAAVGSETSRTGLLAGGKKVKDGVYRLTFKNDRMKDKFMKKYASKIVDVVELKEEYELNEQKGQKFNFARARKVFEKHWREMERKVVNELVQPYEGRGPVNYDLKAERQVSDYFETNTEDLLDYITERFEDLN